MHSDSYSRNVEWVDSNREVLHGIHQMARTEV